MTVIKILVVEDEGIVAKDLQKCLKKIGYTVPTTASSGEEAIKKAAEICPDLVLMDIRLKGDIDGVEAARQIHEILKIPVIYLSAYTDEKTLERAKQTEPFGYIIKPFKERELYTTIEIAFSKYKQEKQLKENQQWLATVIKSIGDGVIATNAHELVTFMNPVAEKLIGWKQKEVSGKHVSEVLRIVNKETRKPIENPLKKVLKDGVIVGQEEDSILISRNGTEIPINDSVAPIKDDKDNIIGAVLVFRDITERQRAIEVRQKQIEQEQLVAQLKQLNLLKDDFLNTVSHELRTPLSNIMMAIQVLQVTGTGEQGQRYLEILQAECDRELELINDLLDLQRVEAATSLLLSPEPLLLQYWLHSIVESFRVRTHERQQTLRLNLPPDIPPLISDNVSLARIFTELLNNACKYTPAGGEIVLSVCREGNEAQAMGNEGESASTERQSDGSHTTIGDLPTQRSDRALCTDSWQSDTDRLKSGNSPSQDTQGGTVLCNAFPSTSPTIFRISNSAEIPAAALSRIFEKFYRVPNANIWQQSGTGLGLALVQKLVEQLQGTIQVESNAGWTTFTLKFFDLAVATD